MLNSQLDVKALLTKMGVNPDEQMNLPSSGMGTGGGFVMPLWAGLVYSISAEVNLAEHNKEVGAENAINPRFAREFGNSGWTRLYWDATTEGYAACEKVIKDFDIRGRNNRLMSPTMTWYVMGAVSEVLSLSDEKKANFKSPDIHAEARVVTLGSRKYRHEYHLIALPMAVSAVARLYREDLGIDEDVDLNFDIREVRNLGKAVTDAEYEALCGHPDEMQGYKTGILWERRKKLWAALGEEDASKYMPIGKGKDCTTSPALSLCLTFLRSSWQDRVWGRFTWVTDPRVDAVSDDGEYRDNLPGLLRLYASEAEARADAAQASDDDDSDETAPATNEPALPELWEGMRDDWIKAIQTLDAVVPLPVAANKLSASTEDITAWRTFLNIG